MDSSKSLVSVSIDGKALEKLIDAVSKGIATLYRPRRIRKEADAKAYAIKVMNQAFQEASSEGLSLDLETQERIVQRLVSQEIRRQENIDTIVELTAQELNGKQVSEEPVNEDWATRFFGIVQDVSQEEMKIFWARILAREIEKPSSISFRTIEILRNISVKEARLFEKIKPFVFTHGDNHFLFNYQDVLKNHGVLFIELVKLVEVGLLQPLTTVNKQLFTFQDRDSTSAMRYGNFFVSITLPAKSMQVDIPIILLTRAGRDIYGLLEPESHMDYLKDFASFVKQHNPDSRIKYATLISESEGIYTYINPLVDVL